MVKDGTSDYFEQHYEVKRIHMDVAKEYIRKHHYTKGCHNAPNPCYGLFRKDRLIGVLMFAQPCSENVRQSIWGKDFKDRVIELHRLHIMDITPRNTESWFISRCMELLQIDKPQIKGILSFADTTEGHEGGIYKATNFYYIGKTGKARFYRDKDGRLRHPRQNSVNISTKQAKAWGWKPEVRMAKNRYLYILAKDKREKRDLIRTCRYDVSHYVWCPECGHAHPIGTQCKCQIKEKIA